MSDCLGQVLPERICRNERLQLYFYDFWGNRRLGKEEAAASIKKFSRIKVQDEILKKVLSRISYRRIDFAALDGYSSLKSQIENVSGEKCAHCERIFYLAVPSELIVTIIDNLKAAGLAKGKM